VTQRALVGWAAAALALAVALGLFVGLGDGAPTPARPSPATPPEGAEICDLGERFAPSLSASREPLDASSAPSILHTHHVEGVIVAGGTNRPLDRADVKLVSGERWMETSTGPDGRFRMESVRRHEPYRLVVRHAEHLPLERECAANERELRLELWPAERIEARVRESVSGELLRGGELQIVAARLDARFANDSMARAWLSRKKAPLDSALVSRSSPARFTPLWPGEYDLELVLTLDTGTRGEWNEPIPEKRVVGRWTLQAGGAEHQLPVDLGGRAPMSEILYGSLVIWVVDAHTKARIVDAQVDLTHGAVTRSYTTVSDRELKASAPHGAFRIDAWHLDYKPVNDWRGSLRDQRLQVVVEMYKP
jgi:hypothetical protein